MAFCRCRLGLWHFPFCFCFVGRKLARSTFFPHFVRAFSILGRTKVYELITEIEWTNQKARNALSEVENLIITNNPSYLEYVTEGHLVTLSLRFCSSSWRDSPLRLPREGGGGGVSKEICGTVRLPVWLHVSCQWLSKWRAKCSSKRRIKISILPRKYCSDFLDLGDFKVSYCHRKLDLSTFLEWMSSGVMNFKDSFLSSSNFYGQSYRPVTLLMANGQQYWGV